MYIQTINWYFLARHTNIWTIKDIFVIDIFQQLALLLKLKLVALKIFFYRANLKQFSNISKKTLKKGLI